MALTIPSEPIIRDEVTYPEGPDGSTPISVYAASGLVDSYGNFLLSPDEEVNTHAVDVVSPSIMDQSLAHELMARITQGFTDSGEELLASTVYSWREYLVTLPVQVCIPIPWGDPICFDVPGGGSEWGEIIRYRLWFMTRPRYTTATSAPRAMGAFAILALFFGIVSALITLTGILMVLTGRTSFSNMVGELRRFVAAPGENLRPATEEIKWAMIAVAAAVVIAAVAAPALAGNVGVRLGGGEHIPGEVTFGVGSGGPPPSRGRR